MKQRKGLMTHRLSELKKASSLATVGPATDKHQATTHRLKLYVRVATNLDNLAPLDNFVMDVNLLIDFEYFLFSYVFISLHEYLNQMTNILNNRVCENYIIFN